MPLLQLAYASRPVEYDGIVLTAILMEARRCNMRDQITGALICREDLFLQLLEGPAELVEATFARICADKRHEQVRELMRREIAEDQRMFTHWAMKYDPEGSPVWSREEVAEGAPEQAGLTGVVSVFRRLAI